MKKHIIAAAVAAAVAAPAMAQNVEIYGIIDAGYSSVTTDTGKGAALSKAKTEAFGNSHQSTSRLGFRGTEDLGGGMKAGFLFETGLTPVSGTTLSGFNTRQAFASLSGASWGALSIGRQYTPIQNIVGAFDVNGANNVFGNLVYNGDIGLSVSNAVVGSYAGTTLVSASGAYTQAATQSYTLRASNSIQYSIPTISGINASIVYFKNKLESQEIGNGSATSPAAITGSDTAGVGFNVTGTVMPGLTVGAAYHDIAVKSTTSSSRTVSADNSTKEWVIAANYTTGPFRIGYFHIEREGKDDIATTLVAPTSLALATGDYKRTVDQVAVSYAFSGTASAFVSYGKGEIKVPTAATGSNTFVTGDMKGYQAGATYALSKRTNLYAIYGQQKQEFGPTVEAKDSQLALGVRHQF